MRVLIVGVAVFTSHMASKPSMKPNVKPLPVRPNVVITPFVSMRPPAGVHQLTNITNTRLHQAPSNSNPSLPVISPSPIIDKTTLKAVSYGAVYKKDSARSFILIARNVIHFSVIIYILLKCSNNMLQTL